MSDNSETPVLHCAMCAEDRTPSQTHDGGYCNVCGHMTHIPTANRITTDTEAEAHLYPWVNSEGRYE